jgi:hypothetical protein
MRGTSAPWHWQGSAPASSTPLGIPSPLAHLPLLPWVLDRVIGSYSAAAQMSISERSSCDGAPRPRAGEKPAITHAKRVRGTHGQVRRAGDLVARPFR